MSNLACVMSAQNPVSGAILSYFLSFRLAEFQSAGEEGALLHAYHWLDVVFPRDSLLQA